MLRSIQLLGITITAETEKKILEYVISSMGSSSKKLFITTPNPEILIYAQKHLAYKDKLNSANIALPDGIGLLLGGWMTGKQLQGRITGVDFIEKLCVETREKPVSMGFLGGRGGVAELTAERLKKKYPWIDVVWVGEEWEFGKNDALRSSFEVSKVERGPVTPHPRSTSSASPAGAHRGTPSRATPNFIDILFVAYGFPKQEEWIYENLPKLPVKAAMGVGGAFDYLSGKVVRAPKVLRLLGLEWLFRLLIQPWRWKRQLALLTFITLVLKEKFASK